MAEVPVPLAGSERMIKELVKFLSNQKYPYKGKIRDGYSQPFPYKVELWMFKMKEEVVPMFLADIKGNTQEIGSSASERRPIQLMVNIITKLMMWTINTAQLLNRFRYTAYTRKRVDKKSNRIDFVDMNKITPSQKQPTFGWIYSKVLGVLKDERNKEGQEEL